MIKIIPDNTGNKIVIQEIIGIVKVKITTAELRDVPSRRFDKPEAHLASRRVDSPPSSISLKSYRHRSCGRRCVMTLHHSPMR